VAVTTTVIITCFFEIGTSTTDGCSVATSKALFLGLNFCDWATTECSATKIMPETQIAKTKNLKIDIIF
jgi:hypothetical protein